MYMHYLHIHKCKRNVINIIYQKILTVNIRCDLTVIEPDFKPEKNGNYCYILMNYIYAIFYEVKGFFSVTLKKIIA